MNNSYSQANIAYSIALSYDGNPLMPGNRFHAKFVVPMAKVWLPVSSWKYSVLSICRCIFSSNNPESPQSSPGRANWGVSFFISLSVLYLGGQLDNLFFPVRPPTRNKPHTTYISYHEQVSCFCWKNKTFEREIESCLYMYICVYIHTYQGSSYLGPWFRSVLSRMYLVCWS